MKNTLSWQERADITRKPEGAVENAMCAEISDLRAYIAELEARTPAATDNEALWDAIGAFCDTHVDFVTATPSQIKNAVYANKSLHQAHEKARADLTAIIGKRGDRTPAAPVVARSDEQIVQQTEELAASLAQIDGWKSSVPFMTSSHPRAIKFWKMACAAQEILTATDPMDAASNVEEGEPEPASPVVAEGLTDAVLDNAAADAFDRTAKARNLSTIDVNPNVTENWTLRRELVAAGWRLSAQAHMAPPTNALRCKDCHDAWPDNDPNCQCITAAAHPVAGSPAEAVAVVCGADGIPHPMPMWMGNVLPPIGTKLYTRPAATEPMPASEAPIGAGDPMAFFADFCDREGYPSDGEMDAALKGAFYEGIRYCCTHTPTAAPVPASEAPTNVKGE